MKILIVFGTRPEAIKMAPLIKLFQEHPKDFSLVVCASGQHREMVKQVIKTFNIPVHYDLRIMRENQRISRTTLIVLNRLEKLLRKEKIDIVIVQGDTSTTFSAALGAYYQKIPVFHIEAGLRTYRKFQPYPEEINRQLITRLTDFHFAPTIRAKNNLISEGISKEAISVTGNTGIDSLLIALKMISKNRNLRLDKRAIGWRGKLIVLTVHRRENIGRPLVNICEFVKWIVDNYPNVNIVFPVHFNPNIKNVVKKLLSRTPRVHLAPPLDYLDFSCLLQHAYLLLTDSGGVQEEAAILGKPVVVFREHTERPEIIERKLGFLVGRDKEKIIKVIKKLMDPVYYKKVSRPLCMYGNGHASEIIVNKIKQLGKRWKILTG